MTGERALAGCDLAPTRQLCDRNLHHMFLIIGESVHHCRLPTLPPAALGRWATRTAYSTITRALSNRCPLYRSLAAGACACSQSGCAT